MSSLFARLLRKKELQPRPIRFVLLAHPRSGSNLVTESLCRSNQAGMFSEALSQWEHVRKDCWRCQFYKAKYEEGMDGAEYLDERLFLRQPIYSIRACGFKLFYDQARFNPQVLTAWDYLRNDREIRIVHLKRANLLASRISLDVALKTDQWLLETKDADKKKAAPPFAADAGEYMHYFDRILAHQQWVEQAFAQHPRLDLEYDRDLGDRFPETMNRIFDFIGIDRMPTEKLLVQQASIPAWEQLTNYEELRQFFRHSVYESFFQPGAPAK